MRFNLLFPMRAVKHYERWIGDADLGEVARFVEEAGFDGISVSDHPFPENGWLSHGGHHSFDPFVALSVMAARTTRIKLITYVLVIAYRHPYIAAGGIASLDVLSRGRVIVGTAAGYLREEFDVLSADFAHRGATLDAAIPAIRAAWAGVDHESALFPSTGHTLAPKPVQPGGPPLWIGGNSAAARRRAVDLAEGWMPMALNAPMAAITRTQPLETLPELKAMITDMQARRAEHGKPPLEVSFGPFEQDLLRTGAEEFSHALSANLAAYEDAGVTWITLEPTSRSFEAFREDVSRIGEILHTRVH